MELLAGPIPGENFTSDTKNYPWHRPPEFDDLDKAIEYVSSKITKSNTSISLMALAKSGVPLVSLSQIILMQGMSRGKWSPDYALLMAGPVTHILSLMAKAGGFKYDLGIEEKGPLYTEAYFEEMVKLDAGEETATQAVGSVLGDTLEEGDLEAPTEPSLEDGPPTTGFMGMAAGEPPSAPVGPSMGDIPPPEDKMIGA